MNTDAIRAAEMVAAGARAETEALRAELAETRESLIGLRHTHEAILRDYNRLDCQRDAALAELASLPHPEVVAAAVRFAGMVQKWDSAPAWSRHSDALYENVKAYNKTSNAAIARHGLGPRGGK